MARQCDAFVGQKCPTYPPHRLEATVRDSRCCKARLLHYFAIDSVLDEAAIPPSSHTDFSSWCGWHNDHGSLTGLTPAMYLDEHGNEVRVHDDSGLYIYSRQGHIVKALLPANHLAFQIGETAQIHSGGVLQATPHAVRASVLPNISRSTFAVFMEPEWGGSMDVPTDVDPQCATGAGGNLPPGMPPLASRWARGQDFNPFTTSTLSAYH